MIDQCHLVSVADLEDICHELSNPLNGVEYRLLKPNDGKVMIRFNDDPRDFMNLNALCYTFPIIVSVPGLTLLHNNLDAGLMCCLSIYTALQTQCGLYLDGEGELKHDGEGDWNRFWQPLVAKLMREVETQC
jgi:hypothetical protein